MSIQLHKHNFWVEFVNDRSVLVKQGQTILEASLAAGIPHYHACGGHGRCTTCRIQVHSGGHSLTEYSPRERVLRRKVKLQENIRLACQTRVKGPGVQVHRMIRDESDIDLYLHGGVAVDLQNSGDERELALFFLDIRNFTPFMESYLPFDVIHVMRRLFAIFKACVEHCRGTIIETSGDGFYAVFGLEEDIKAAVKHAYGAGKNLLNELEHFNEQYLRKHFDHAFEVGIGIHSGRVIVGNIGIGVNNNLTVMGMPVNIASRIQTATKEVNNSFLVSDAAFRHLDVNNTKQVNISPKGVKEPVVVHLCGKEYENVNRQS
jgi:adenylate cyclase